MKNFLALLSVLLLTGCGTGSITASQELSDLQGSWSGSGTAANSSYTGTASFTVGGPTASLAITGEGCPTVTFTIPLTMQPGKALSSSGFTAEGTSGNGDSLAVLRGSFVSANQITVFAPYQTTCQTQSVDAQFTLSR